MPHSGLANVFANQLATQNLRASVFTQPRPKPDAQQLIFALQEQAAVNHLWPFRRSPSDVGLHRNWSSWGQIAANRYAPISDALQLHHRP